MINKASALPLSRLQAAGYTLFAALLISLISWLVLRVTLKAINKRVETSEDCYHQLLVNSLDWAWETDRNGNISYSSSQIFDILGYTEEEVLSKPFNSFFESQDAKTSALVWQQKLMLNEAFNNLEISFYNRSKQVIYLLLSGHPILNKHKKLIGYRGIARDISALKHREGKMISMAFYDPLTKLANRTHFIDRLRNHLKSQMPSNSLKPSALLFIDLDGFKDINDNKGHEAGDQLLKAVALRTQNHARKTDLVGRFGGDEFVILVNHMEKTLPKDFKENMESYLSRLLEIIREPINIGDQLLTVGASIGVAIIPRDGKTVSDILNHADTAMYQAKAIENNEFEIYYQFQFNTLTDKIIGMEAFIRWHHPETHKILPANEFLKLAKDTNNIIAIDQWVINTVAQHIAKLNKDGITLPPISINLSTEKLEESSLPKMIENMIKRNFISAESIKIEITESSLLHDLEKSNRTLDKLRNLGIKVCIDNFGTGYSSLSYLQDLPIEAIKMDQSFIQNIATSHSDLQMCRTFIQLAKSLQLDILAEGVQSSVQKDILQKEGCYLSQGYLFSHPEPLSKIIKYLKETPLVKKN
ncbi:MAG: GGDEF domain-containing protein [Pseudomonadota bacterium]|nr:GGDEF domain-containing protein [Pseudomonadota bacterium]